MLVDEIKALNQQYEAGLISGIEYDSKSYEIFMRKLTQFMVEGVDLYKPTHLADVKLQKAKAGHAIQMIKNSLTNESAEAIEGEGISMQEKVFNLIDTHPQLELVRNITDSYRKDPLLLPRFSQDIVNIFHWILEKVYTKLDSSVIPASLPSYLEFSDGKIVAPSAQAKKESLTLSQLFEQFLKAKTAGGLSETICKEYRSYISGIVHFIGDIEIGQIEKIHIKNCLHSYLKLPVRNKKPYIGKSISELVAMDIPTIDLIKPKTMTQVKKLLQGMFRFAVDQNYLTQSPATDIKIRMEQTSRRGDFSNTQIANMLDAANDLSGKHEWKKWIIRLAAYTGARSGELAQLRVEDVLYDDDSSSYYLLITPDAGPTKTANAFRTIPLHSKLIEWGLLDYIEGKQGRIFPINVDSKTVSQWFPSFRKANNIPDKNDFDESLVFHSFRHSVVTLLYALDVDSTPLQQIVGHEITDKGVTKGYTHRIPIKNLKPIIERINYS